MDSSWLDEKSSAGYFVDGILVSVLEATLQKVHVRLRDGSYLTYKEPLPGNRAGGPVGLPRIRNKGVKPSELQAFGHRAGEI
jgi:hypothetical protein